MKLKKFVLENKKTSFIVIAALAIILTRLSILIYDPNPKMFGFELHHFDYAITILLITSLIALFNKKESAFNLVAMAFSFGWLIDDLSYIRINLFDFCSHNFVH